MRELTTYIIYYHSNDEAEGYEIYGYKALMEALKWLHSAEVNATDISIYTHGKDFANNQDDVIEVYRQYWK